MEQHGQNGHGGSYAINERGERVLTKDVVAKPVPEAIAKPESKDGK